MNHLFFLQKTLSCGEAALIFSSVGRQYLSGFSSSDGVFLITSQEAFLYLDSRYLEMAQEKQKKRVISSQIQLMANSFSADFPKFAEEKKICRVYLEDGVLSHRKWMLLCEKYPFCEFLPLGDRIEEQRMVKSEEEIIRIGNAQKLAEEAFCYILPRLQKGRTETEIAAELEYFMKKNGASGTSFDTICVSGVHSSMPHGKPENIPLQDGFLTLDFGCVLDGYCSDMTRTVCLGKASEEMKLVYETVLAAQKAAIASVRAGVLGKDVDRAARDRIALAGYGEYFGHSTGHGIGLEVHEAPSFSPNSETIIPERAILSVEPGIYLPGKFGVRIEDLVVVREWGAENLNQTSKELLEL